MEKEFLPIVFEFKMLNKHYILNNITLVNLYCGMERGGGVGSRATAGTVAPGYLDKKTVKVHSKFCS